MPPAPTRRIWNQGRQDAGHPGRGDVDRGTGALAGKEMIRRDKVHALVVTGANLEEDIFNLVAHDSYERVPKLPAAHPQG